METKNMKITKSQLKEIIRETIKDSLNEKIDKDKFHKATMDTYKVHSNISMNPNDIFDAVLSGLILDKGISGAKKWVKEVSDMYKQVYLESVNEVTYDSRAKSFLDAVRVVDSSIKDLKNITVDATPQGNWTVYHKGRVLTTVNRKMLDDKTISKYGLEESVQPLMEWSAREVIKQLGGNKFMAMTGAKYFPYNAEKTLWLKIPRAKNGINWVIITLKGSDTYTMEFISLRPGQSNSGPNAVKTVKRVDGVYNDQLQSIFTQYTGLDTSL